MAKKCGQVQINRRIKVGTQSALVQLTLIKPRVT